MTSARIATSLCLVLLVIGQGVTAPTNNSVSTEPVGDNASSGVGSPKQGSLDYDDAGDNQVLSLLATGEPPGQGSDGIADADAEYQELLSHLEDDYEEYSSPEDVDADSDKIEQGTFTRSGNMLLTPSGYRGDSLGAASSGFPEIQQNHGISQTLNPAYFAHLGQSNFPALKHRQVISQTLNPAYAMNQNNQYYGGKANAAKLLYLLGHLSNEQAGYGQYGQYGHSSLNRPVLSGTLGGRLSYGHTVIRHPGNSNSYGSLGVINAAGSGLSSSGSNYDFLPSAGSSYPVSSLGGQSLIQLIRPIAQLVAIQQTSPKKHWHTFLNNLNEAKISGSGVYQTLYEQINYESQRQERIIRLLKRYRQIAAQRRVCTQIGK